jgi:glutamine amidotransferase/cyclase
MATAVPDIGGDVAQRPTVHVLDYGAGNIRSLTNAVQRLGYEPILVATAAAVRGASAIIFPGVGAFGAAMAALREGGLGDALRAHIGAGKPYFGICLGMQTLLDASQEGAGTSETLEGLGVVPGIVSRFDDCNGTVAVPTIGWNGLSLKGDREGTPLQNVASGERVYFVHSYRGLPSEANKPWVLATASYGGQEYIAAIQRGAAFATQFHPEKSGQVGLRILGNWLREYCGSAPSGSEPVKMARLAIAAPPGLSKRVVAALDVRTNDEGDLVVTKGDQYDVREELQELKGRGAVRNLGKPVQLASRYYEEGVDEIAFLNITSFRSGVLGDSPMLQVLERTSEQVFVPLTVGGGIRAYRDQASGTEYSALEVAARYFRAGADKVSLGSDAVEAAEALRARNGKLDGSTAIEQISRVYGAQAVVVSIDPRRVWIPDEASAPKGAQAVKIAPVASGPSGEEWCWYQATVKGGREGRDIDAVEVARASARLGAGEIMLNSIDHDGQKAGFDLALIRAVAQAVPIPVIASSGAGCARHFSEVFLETGVQAALAAGMFHRSECPIAEVKQHLEERGLPVRTIASL